MQHLSSSGSSSATRRYGWLTLLWLLCFGSASAQITTIGSTAVPVVAPATSSYLYGPIYRSSATSTFNFSRYAHLYTPAELNITTGAVITELAWLKSDAGTLTGSNTFTVLLSNSALTGLGTTQTWGTLSAGATQVYTSTAQQITGAAGDYFIVTLSQPFVYTGGNLLVLSDHEKQGVASNVISFVTNPATGFALGYANDAALTAATALTSGSYGNRRPTLRVTYAPSGPCTSPPTAGTTIASASSVCTGNSVNLSLQGASFGTGQTYQWQVSTNGTTFTDIAGATSPSYNTPVLTATRTYRAVLTCSGQSANSTAATVTVSQVTYAALPVLESFENTWVNGCGTNDIPNNSWRNAPFAGNNSWRRDDDGASAGWSSPTSYSYTPAGSQGTHSARFHSGSSSSGLIGTLDLFVNLSAAGAKRLSFDYINTSGTDSLVIQISTDGGVTFGRLAGYSQSGTTAAGFVTQVLPISSTSATAVIRFRGRADFGSTDIGLDNVIIESATGCLTPANLAVTGTTATTAVVSWLASGTGTYSVVYGPTGFNPATGGTTVAGIAGSPYTITGLAASTSYQFYVTQNCGAGSNSGTAGPVSFSTACLTPAYATLPVLESFENNWLSNCGTNEAPSNSWRNTPVTGNNSWRRDDDVASAGWTLPTSYLYTPVASQGTHSARFHSGYTASGVTGSLDLFVNLSAAGAKRLSFDMNNSAGTDSLTIQISNDGGVTFTKLASYGVTGAGFATKVLPISSTSATAVIRFLGRGDFGSNDIGLDNVVLEAATGCLTPANLTVTATTATSATVSWLTGGPGTYTVVYGPTGFNPATGGTTVTGLTAPPYTITGLTASTTYQFYVTQNCAAGVNSSTAGPVSFTTACVTPTYATLPVTESFEGTWISRCGTNDVPTNNWRNTPVTGNNSWRREDDGTSAAWVSPTSYAYTPVASQGTHSARFHSGQASSGLIGTLDLFVNLSAAGAKRLSFDYINTSGSDSLVIQISNNGGATFSRLAGYNQSGTAATGFVTQVLPISSTSATAVIRFRGRADFGVTDIGLDNIILEAATGCLTPATLTATTTTTTASLSWLTGGTGTYTVVYGPTGFNPATGGTTVAGITAPPLNLTGLTPGTTYQFYVTLNCAAGANSGTAGPASFSTQILNDEPCGATTLTVNNTCVTLNSTMMGATATTGIAAGTCASFPVSSPQDVWYKFTTAATGPTSTIVRLSVTGASANTIRVYSGACAGPLTFVSCASAANGTTASPNLDLTALTPSTTYYVRVATYSTTQTNLGPITICATPVPNCPTPAGLGVGTITNTTAVVNWSAPALPGSTFTVTYGPTGFTPGGTGSTTVSGITGLTTTLNGLQPSTTYQFYVMQVCGGFNGSSAMAGPFSFTTPLTAPANDEPCGALVLGTTVANGSNVGATTSVQNGINLPACSGAQLPKDVWYSFTPTATSTTLTITGSAAGMVRVYSSPNCATGPFNLVTCASSGANNTAITAPIPVTGLTVGQRYYVAVSGYGSSDTAGSFTLAGTGLALGTKAQAETNALVVYPNPSNTGQLTLRLAGLHGAGQATLLNALGQLVRTAPLTGTTEQVLSTRGLAAGVYTLRVAVDGNILTRKVVLD